MEEARPRGAIVAGRDDGSERSAPIGPRAGYF
jgi:hypothetical protein